MFLLWKLFKNSLYCSWSDGGSGDDGSSDDGGFGGDDGFGGGYGEYGGFAGGGSAAGITGNAEQNAGMGADIGLGGDTIGGGYGSLGVNTNIAPATETTFNSNMEVTSVTTHAISAEPGGYSITSNTVTTGYLDTDFDHISIEHFGKYGGFNTNIASVTGGTVASHLYGLGLSVQAAIISEAIVNIAVALISPSPLGVTFEVAKVGLESLGKIAGVLGIADQKDIDVLDKVLDTFGIAYGFAKLGMAPLGMGYAAFGLAQISDLSSAGRDIEGFGGEFDADGGDSIISSYGKGDTRNISSPLTIYSPLSAGDKFNKDILISDIKPSFIRIPLNNTKEEGNNMEAVVREYRGGLNNILAPHLIQSNEGQVFTNINIDRAIMESVKKGTQANLTKAYTYSIPGGYTFQDDYPFNIAKIGNFYYISSENPNIHNISRIELNQPILTISDLVNIDITAPTFTPSVTAVVDTSVTYNVTASLVNIKDSSGNEETYTASVTSDYNTDIHNALINNTPVTINGTCSSGTPDGRTININVEGKIFTTTSSSQAWSISIDDLSFLSQVLERVLWDEYQYAITYYNELTGYESIPVFTTTWTRKSNKLQINGIVNINASDVDKIRIYRIGGYSSVYRRIAEIDNLKDGSVTTYVDTVDDVLTYGILDTDNATDILDLKGLIEHKGSLFAFKNNQVYFSKPGKPNIWSEFNMVRVGGIVTGIASVPLGIVIMTDAQQIYLLSGTDKTNFNLSCISKTTGCVDYKSVSNIRNNAIWLGYEGIMVSVGASVSNISRGRVDVSDIGVIYGSYTYDNIYYLFGSNYVLLGDFTYNRPSFRKLDLSIKSMYFNQGVISYTDGITTYDGLYDNGIELDLHYKSFKFIGQSYDLLKEFNKIDLVYNGTFTYIVYIDDIQVLSKNITSTKITVEEINIPSEINEGLSIELELVGTGKIYSYKYIFTYLNNN